MASATTVKRTNYEDNITPIKAEPLNNVEKAVNHHAALIDTKYATPSFTVVTLAYSNWANKQYSFEGQYPRSNCNLEVQIAPTATIEQYEAFSAAKIAGSHDSNIITALGEVPGIDIPVILTVYDLVQKGPDPEPESEE